MRRHRIALGALAVCLAITAPSSAALAKPCETCDPGGGGSGGGGGGTASPVSITGTFRYRDANPNGGAADMRPIVGVNVEIWRFAPHIGPIWTWAHDGDTTTDAGGSVSTS